MKVNNFLSCSSSGESSSVSSANIRFIVNGRFAVKENPTGVQKWALEVLKELRKQPGFRAIATPPKCFSSGFLGHLWEQFYLPFCIGKGDVLVSLANWGPLLVQNQIIVVHDLIPITNPEFFSLRYRFVTRLLGRKLVKRCKYVATTSNLAARDISLVTRRKIEDIIVLGSANTLSPKIQKVLKRTWNYFLIVGGDVKRKNLEFLLNFWDNLPCSPMPHLLVVCGRNSSISQKVTPALSSIIDLVHNPEDDELSELYSGAIAVLSPSIVEGFGLPLIEGLAHGVPFISSNTGAAEELKVGESQVLELVPSLWIEKITHLTETNGAYSKEVYLKKASEFSWDNIAIRIVRAIN